MKRAYINNIDLSDDENFSGDGFSTEQLSERKKRRGMIEKRRRDKINGCLAELRRLVPSAFEKQGSTKLEKAEILQLTVEHLRILNSKGVSPDSSIIMDYRALGFRDCLSEVDRYFNCEGIEQSHPLRQRLLSHLHSLSQQNISESPYIPSPPPPQSPMYQPLHGPPHFAYPHPDMFSRLSEIPTVPSDRNTPPAYSPLVPVQPPPQPQRQIATPPASSKPPQSAGNANLSQLMPPHLQQNNNFIQSKIEPKLFFNTEINFSINQMSNFAQQQQLTC